MTKIVTLIKNNRKSTIHMILATGKKLTLKAGEEQRIEGDLFTIADQGAKYKLEKMEATGEISIRTLMQEASKIVELKDGSVTMTDAPKEVIKEAPQEQPKTEAAPKDKQPQGMNLFGTNENYRVVNTDSNMAKIGARPVTTEHFDEHRGMENHVDTDGFVEVAPASHSDNIFTRQSNLEKVDAPGLFSKGSNIIDQAKAEAVKDTASEQKQEAASKVSTEEDVMKDYVDKLIADGDWDTLQDYLKMHYPNAKFNKNSLKSCKSYADIKEKFSI